MHERESKWQGRWAKEKVFEANPDKRDKFFCTFPYPYVNGLPHVGHLFTIMRVDAFARYHRHLGRNVLFPQAWHATGSPIAIAAKRVAQREKTQLAILRDSGVKDSELGDFSKAEHWIDYFAPRYKKDLSAVGLSIDWRREFYTTSLNPHYDAFIRWQFETLKDKGYVQKGKHPVVWDPKENMPVGDHDRIEGEGETPQEFVLVKHRLPDGRYLVSATLRPDTILGVTNLFVNPRTEYVQATVNNETWVLGENAAKNLPGQGHDVSLTGRVSGGEIIGLTVREYSGRDVPILPATFLDNRVGTGLVHAVPSDSADDLIALLDIQSNDDEIEKYNLDSALVKSLVPIPVLDTEELGDCPAAHFIEKYEVKNQNEKKKLEKIRQELYKIGFYKSTFNKLYESMGLAGKQVSKHQDDVKKRLVDEGWATIYYELTGRVVSRSRTDCVVKIVEDQWFLTYGDEAWTKNAHDALEACCLYPETVRTQFLHVLDWLNDWACTREYGLGTRLPWDDRWLIESLSDSTIYMAYYTIAHRIKDVAPENLTREFFDWIFLGKGSIPKVKNAQSLRDEFLYWYPLDFRNSGKDLVQNHLSFMLFNHCAIFPKEHWPKSIGVNGWVTVNGKKMSKSLGNVIPVRQLLKEYGADATRITILNGGEGLDDPNWDSDFARGMHAKLDNLIRKASDVGDMEGGKTPVDAWFVARMNEHIRTATKAMDQTNFRTALQESFFEMGQSMTWYEHRSGVPNATLYREAFKKRLVMLAPFIPHACEEAWHIMGEKQLVALAKWPEYEDAPMDSKLGVLENMIQHITETVRKRGKSGKLLLFISDDWKREAYESFDASVAKTRNPKEILDKMMKTSLGEKGVELQRLVQFLVKSRTPGVITSAKEEISYLESSREYLSRITGEEVEILDSKTEHDRASSGLPGRPGISFE